MAKLINRRNLIRNSFVMASGALFAPLVKPFFAAQVATILNYALADAPLQMLVALFEFLSSIRSGQESKDRINEIASQLASLAEQQRMFLQQLANQRIVMREEIKRGFLDNDVRKLHGAANHFKIALLSDDETKEAALRSIVGQMDELTTQISDYGLPAVPAYVTAIALQNAAHYALGSSQTVFIAINEAHHNILIRLLNGNGQGTLSHFVKYSLDPLVAEGSSPDAQRLLTDFGIGYALALISIKYEKENYWQTDPALTFELRYTYEGFRKGMPVFEETTSDDMYGKYQGVSGYRSDVKGRKAVSANIWFGLINESGINQSAIDYKNIPGLLPPPSGPYSGTPEENLEVNSKGEVLLNNESLKIIQGQVKALTDYYLKSYDPQMGDITRERVSEMRKNQEDMRQLLTRGLEEVDKILVMERNVGSYP